MYRAHGETNFPLCPQSQTGHPGRLSRHCQQWHLPPSPGRCRNDRASVDYHDRTDQGSVRAFRSPRITSYNVCYTKLLRLLWRHATYRTRASGACENHGCGSLRHSAHHCHSLCPPRLCLRAPSGYGGGVITSYSIHYTKLYEIRKGVTIGAGATVTRDVEPGTLIHNKFERLIVKGWKRPTKKK